MNLSAIYITSFVTTIVFGLVLAFILKRTSGLQVAEEDRATSLDKLYWDIEPDIEPSAETASAKVESSWLSAI